jgi:hypothetical protein
MDFMAIWFGGLFIAIALAIGWPMFTAKPGRLM